MMECLSPDTGEEGSGAKNSLKKKLSNAGGIGHDRCFLHQNCVFALKMDDIMEAESRAKNSPKKKLYNAGGIGSVLHQDEGGIRKSIPDAQEIYNSRVLVEDGHSFIINFSTESGSGNPSLWTGKDLQC